MSVKISNFINDPWRVIAMDAERRGSKITSKTGIRVEGTGTILIGLCDVIREMQERIQKLEGIK